LLPGGGWYSVDTFNSRHGPGTYFTYSNINFGLMGTLVERLSNMRFDIYMKKNVFDPMGLKASYFLWDLAAEVNDIAILYRKG
jgi:CubicO group peptidase (beta-lactamase class C family)